MEVEPNIFDRAMEGHGGRLDRAAIGPSVARLFDFQRKRALSFLSGVRAAVPTLPPIHFDFVNGTDVNAVALKHEGEYCIAINAGVILVLSVLFGHAFASAEFLPEIGDATKEGGSPTFHPRSWDFQQLMDRLPVTPQDNIRFGYFRHFVEDAFDFLVSHEVAHIVNGHLDYLGETNGTAFLVELEGGTPVPSPELTRQTLEMDADCCAVGNAIHSILGKAESIATIPDPWKQFYRDTSQALFFWEISIYCLFRIFGDTRFTDAALRTSLYPPVRMRQFMVGSVAHEYLLKRRPDLEERFCDDVGKVVALVERVFAAVFGSPLTVAGLQDVLSPIGFEHMEALRKHWKGHVRGDLVRFARTQLAP